MQEQLISNVIPYLLPAAFILMLLWGLVKRRRMQRVLPQLISCGAQIVDVRSTAEFAAGHMKGSQNLPLDKLLAKATQLDKNKPIILCCASGTRSAMAAALLKKQGFSNVVNAGSWRNIPSQPHS